MNIWLPIEHVDSLVDIALGGRTDVSYERDVIYNPQRITYKVTFTDPITAPWKIRLHALGDSTEITFPVHVEPSKVFRYPRPGGITVELFEIEPPIYDDPIDNAKYVVCHSVWTRIKFQEGLRVRSDTEPTDRDQSEAGNAETEDATGEPEIVISERTTALNKLAVLWVGYNQAQRASKFDDMKWFLSDRAESLGLSLVTEYEFKRYLPKAYKAGVIDKDKKTGHFIPKSAT